MIFSVIGYGSVGRPFALGLVASGGKLAGIGLDERNPGREVASADGMPLFQISELPLDVDLLALAIPDDTIAHIAGEIAKRVIISGIAAGKPVVVHFAGRYGLSPLDPLRKLGFPCMAWHPVQTFIHGVGPERFKGITAGTTADYNALEMAEDISRRLGVSQLYVPESKRAAYHHSCVLISNFLPLLMELASSRLADITPSKTDAATILLPLLRGMVENLEPTDKGSSDSSPALPGNYPASAMTGPVARDDLAAVLSHLDSWNDQDGCEVYITLTRALVNMAVRNGMMSPNKAEEWHRQLHL